MSISEEVQNIHRCQIQTRTSVMSFWFKSVILNHWLEQSKNVDSLKTTGLKLSVMVNSSEFNVVVP